jgi:hypothetical protein
VSLRNTTKKLYLIPIHEICALSNLTVHKEFFISGYFEPGSEGKEEKSKKSTREGGEIAGDIPSAYFAAPQGRKARMP